MMIFFGLVLLIFYLSLLILGREFYKAGDQAVEEMDIKEDEEITEDKSAKILKGCMFAIGFLLVYILEVVFTISAVSVDVYLYPTVFMLALMVVSWVRSILLNSKYKKHPELKEYHKKKNRTVYGVIAQLLKITFFIYILILLIL